MEHTKEPWQVGCDEERIMTNYRDDTGSMTDDNWVRGGHPKTIATVSNRSWLSCNETRANARRIVACVNACVGLKTELLETKGYTIKAELDSLDEQTNKRLEDEKHIEELNKYIKKLEETPTVIDFKMKPIRIEIDIEEFKSMYLTKLSPISKDVYDSIATAFKSYIEAKNNIKD